ncbi:phosphatase PAP2 family protein [uncultured Megasphaera sp.]|uniref:phosphatase PAP2 family protein n=1 Tax=uncultured Megasphaera sp. TaxID=165188 RepID=UPI00259BAD56|nr:phosphatase PAP2 family protein [uncultured Megasphaera sp.]
MRNDKIKMIWAIITRFGYLIYIIYGIYAWLYPCKNKQKVYQRQSLIYCLGAVFSGSIVSWLIGKLWYRPRPFVQQHITPWHIHRATPSFPSNHAMNSIAVSLLLVMRGHKAGWGLLLWSVILACSRFFCRLHYWSDIIGGMFLGGSISLLIYKSDRMSRVSHYIVRRCARGEILLKQWLQGW